MADQRLNFVVVQTDDQGWWAMPHRMPELQMPRLEELVSEGAEYTNYYCASPVCSPARASLLTGRAPSAHGVHDWLQGGHNPEAWPDEYLAGQPTTPELLARAGYQCWMSGKWHLGDASRPAPGFEGWYAHRFGGGPYVGAPIWRDGEPAEEPRYFTHAVTEEALAFIEQRDAERPFYLQVNYTAPHDPWLEGHPEEYTSRYQDCDFESVPRTKRHPWTESVRHFDGAYDDPHPRLVGFCAALTAVDDGLGRILDALAAEGLSENTVVIFTSDNGFACGHHGLWGKGNGSWPLNFWDSSVRVPMVVKLPGGRRGSSDALLSALHVHATICELAGVELPPDRWRAEESQAALWRGEQEQGAEAIVIAAEYGMGRMVTDGRFVYIHRGTGPDELYDHAEDPGEEHNLIDSPAAAADLTRLRSALEAWFAQRERPSMSGWKPEVSGRGQLHPVSRGLPDSENYV